MSEPSPEVVRIQREFRVEEVRAFAALSGDAGAQHVQPDATGRLMVHGLLLATLPTEVGGRLNFLARELHFTFLRPAFTGTPIVCTVTVIHREVTSKGTRLECTFTCCDPEGNVLMEGRTKGLVPGRALDGAGPA